MARKNSSDPAALSVAELEGALNTSVKRRWKSPLYSLGLLVVAAAMVVLPLIYLGLICAVGYALYYHAVENLSILSGSWFWYWRLILYGTPLPIGVVILAFMIKPLFARPSREERRISLVREHEPLLFAFVDRLCQVVGASKPRRIDVTCEVNASAGFRRGFISFLGRDLVLTIGAPVVAGLTLRQFAGVLAHEFGHFSQGFGMRLSYIVDRINHWFGRVVYERDSWDDWLIEVSEDDDRSMGFVFLMARGCVWLTRRILWLLMTVGHMISCGMSRQMEYDADGYQSRLAGSDSLDVTMHRIGLLGAASRQVYEDLWESWKDRRLGDNLPALIVERSDLASPGLRKTVAKDIAEQRTKAFSTHPAAGARITRAREAEESGVFHMDGPASALFCNFDALCRNITLFHYQELIGPEVTRENLISAEKLAKMQREVERSRLAATRYFQGCLSPLRPLAIDMHSQAFKLSPKDCLTKLKQARAALAKSFPRIRRAYREYDDQEATIGRMRLARTLLQAEQPINAKEYDLPKANHTEAMRKENTAESRRQELAGELARGEAVLALRLECAFALLRVDQVAERIAGAVLLRRRSTQLIEALTHAQVVADGLTGVRRDLPALLGVGKAFLQRKDGENLYAVAGKLIVSIRDQLGEVRPLMLEQPYPFEHAEGKVTMARYALNAIPATGDLGETFVAAEEVLDSMDTHYERVMGELAQTAVTIESALGLPALAPTIEATTPTKDG